MQSTDPNPAIIRLKRIGELLESRYVFKVMSNSDSDRIPCMAQFGIDMVGWIEINRLAHDLNFPALGPDGKFCNIFSHYFLHIRSLYPRVETKGLKKAW